MAKKGKRIHLSKAGIKGTGIKGTAGITPPMQRSSPTLSTILEALVTGFRLKTVTGAQACRPKVLCSHSFSHGRYLLVTALSALLINDLLKSCVLS